ncbi:diguanylate cyclase [Dictyoglomus thermophilum]|uniref:Diguanylate cyclase n=1 Tax=Dictyoglomus thermophilum TaxID=14 RepID=A0A7V3ZJZ7_DICTH|nr:diguanylate cyclase [Dictyoglomus thermophilum]TYT24084.1 diguanylate cyclase [Dictyoglomus thermophilum]
MKEINGKLIEVLILDTLKEMVIVLDKEMNIVYANKSAQSSLDLDLADIIGKKCYRLWHLRDTPCPNCPVINSMETKEVSEGEITTPDGRVWRIKSYPLKNERDEIIGAIEITQEITEAKILEAEIRYLTFHDKLTGLYNRAFFEEELKRLDTKRQLPISIVMGDLNGLKLVNDAFGHNEGDKLLKGIAEVLKRSCRKEDIIARWGGDEFVIIFPKTPKDVVEKICERIKENCKKYNQETDKNHPIPLSIALGYATKEKEDEEMTEILRKAEDRMYRNKLIEDKTFRDSIIRSLKNLLWENTFENEEHEKNIKDLVVKMSDILTLSDIDREALIFLSHFHDIGEIAIPKEIMKKPEKLTPTEFEKVKVHPETGYRIAITSHELAPIAEYILTHHEWWNGEGYPRGLKAEEIPLVSRIFAIADAYEVMTSGRPYKKAKTKEEAIEELRKFAGIQFDPKLVEVFINII